MPKDGLAMLKDDELQDDGNYMMVENVPVLKPGEEVTIIITVANYWIFDPNIEAAAEADPKNTVKESNETNNTGFLFMNG
ncbi:MAG: hypothetical protein K2X86_11375 [Cytophagaceae bacterium]|nr:hypothetical protein [Cytophagaceae bacterium]